MLAQVELTLLAPSAEKLKSDKPHLDRFSFIANGTTKPPLPLSPSADAKRKPLTGVGRERVGRAWVPSVGEWGAEKGHSVALEDGGDRGAVGVCGAGGGSEFLEERVPTAGREHDDQLGRLVGQVQERVG